MTAPAEPARAVVTPAQRAIVLADLITEVHLEREALQRQADAQQQSGEPHWKCTVTARDAERRRDTENYLTRRLRELPGGER